jgi:8-oxo-dGTP pyrophosphatase MutT (NUDIX family)/phosphohistidine swiveling domain-containing protein
MAEIVREPVSAGGLVLRHQYGSVFDVALIRQEGVWRLPKGMVECDENLPTTAIREVSEETGVTAAVLCKLDVAQWTYTYRDIVCRETCHFFLMVAISIGDYLDPDGEVEQVKWFPLRAAADVLHYKAEKDVAILGSAVVASGLSSRISIASGLSTGSRTGSGLLALSRNDAEDMIERAAPVVLVLPSFSPADAALVAHCRAVATIREGPTSHIAVVAAAIDVPCLTLLQVDGVVGNVLRSADVQLPTGVLVEVDEGTGDLSVLLRQEVVPSGAVSALTLTQRAEALEWAEGISTRLRLGAITNYKLFKRDLLQEYYPTPHARRFLSPWVAVDVIAYASTLVGGVARCSAFPKDIACHSESFVMDNCEGGEFAARLARIPRDADLEVFIQQATDNLCWRLVINNARFTIEAGIGQAMYVFEEERGRHATANASWTLDVAEGPLVSGDEGVGVLLRQFLSVHMAELITRTAAAKQYLDLEVFAIEGYYDTNTRIYVTCDMDLPFDQAFMG